ncbi:LytTR family transcriptional regulator DNA-binding domain-containing protein [Paenibacillus vini]|uniref:LytTR family transcriptional regulator DNA-binding domain-containing protein n=1 Tax=Paenibacillus vini TaxID=1476024 RepID=UPI0025B70A78|nr:LytTR family transcriptional regulator DNA-binding domain-containing protein [Paenibacillus vini]MDN4067561.1 LytTR family transcriptional regulator DNA-binding domain-containing protein [Paenibacillus vini]
MDKAIGKYLECLRLSCGYSLREAAKITKLSHGYIRDVELGAGSSKGTEIIPQPQTLKKFAHAYTASYNYLMKIAGHINNDHEDSNSNFEFVLVDFNTILFIEVDYDNNVIYQGENYKYIEKKSLHEFILFEETLEENQFLRIQSGHYINLIKVKAYDTKNSRLYFNEFLEGQYLSISRTNALKHLKIINKAINNNLQKNSKPPMVRIVRNIITN